jgi:hypothetical protein
VTVGAAACFTKPGIGPGVPLRDPQRYPYQQYKFARCPSPHTILAAPDDWSAIS